ncbi:hypothetical protein NQ314_010189 [Rhamnusium bicolor]|uniref:DDE Tnp4 domain-containing protein n=1 Tax=Rhamnusium bicolor TaxID=1586634 RepID=A0AAV8XUF9_9CUCU|nr:hypothetical protein NQ314_010189 [Rhamnusium bicolor]
MYFFGTYLILSTKIVLVKLLEYDRIMFQKQLITELTNKILAKLNFWIQFPSSTEEIKEAKQLWQEKYNFPSALGALDCTHVRIPKTFAIWRRVYVQNRKGFASLNIQAICDALDRFTNVDVQWPGSTHASRIAQI